MKWIRPEDKLPPQGIESLGEGKYKNGKEREGVVVRSKSNQLGHKPIYRYLEKIQGTAASEEQTEQRAIR